MREVQCYASAQTAVGRFDDDGSGSGGQVVVADGVPAVAGGGEAATAGRVPAAAGGILVGTSGGGT